MLLFIETTCIGYRGNQTFRGLSTRSTALSILNMDLTEIVVVALEAEIVLLQETIVAILKRGSDPIRIPTPDGGTIIILNRRLTIEELEHNVKDATFRLLRAQLREAEKPHIFP
jgi:hypothetical protein